MLKTLRICLVVVAIPALAQAQYDEIENPGRVAAVQERLYRMTHELDVGFGTLPLDAFYKGYFPQLGYAYHFDDRFAWQVLRAGYSFNTDTGLKKSLERDFGVLPTTFETAQFFGTSDLMFKPFYGKTTLMNATLLYFEAHLLLGASVFKFSNNFRPGIHWGGGVRMFLTETFSVRFDATDHIVVFPKLGNVVDLHLSIVANFGTTE